MKEGEQPTWRRGNRCDSGSCVEMAVIGDGVAVRDSSDLGGPWLSCTPADWRAFVRWAGLAQAPAGTEISGQPERD